MASTRITINPNNSPVAARLIGALSALRDAVDDINSIHAIGESAANGADYTSYNEVIAGVTGESSSTLYNLIGDAKTALNVSAITTLLARAGQR